MDRSLSRRVLAAALGIGLLAELLLDGPAPGINVLLLVGVVLAVGWAVRRPGRAPDPLDAWLPVAALVFAGFVAVRADPFLAVLDVVVAGAATGASMAAFSGLAVTRRSFGVLVALGLWLSGAVVAAAGPVTRRAAPSRGSIGMPAWLPAVGRGLVIGVPMAVIFAVLFASADPIFRRTVEDVLGLRIDLGDLPGRALFTLAVAWLAAGLLSVAASGVPVLERASLGAAARTVAAPTRWLGSTEALVTLLLVDLVVAGFVALQVAYLFGGLDTLAVIGLTYAEYARRGFFELVAAAALAGGLLVVLDLAVHARSRAYLVAAIGLVVLTLVVLASAALRLQLYQDAYGWTELRLYVAVTIAALALGLVGLAALLALARIEWIGHVLAGIGLASLVVLNLIAPAHFVAERNLARAADPSLVPPDGDPTLDWRYLRVLPDDAVPAMVSALPGLDGVDRERVLAALERRRAALADPAVTSPAAWNLGRERARAALEEVP